MNLDPASIGVSFTGLVLLGSVALYVIRAEIRKAKNPDPQPKNGGTGWSDVHSKLDTVIDRQVEVIDDLGYLRKRIDGHIEWHMDKE